MKTAQDVRAMKQAGEKITVVTAYDASFTTRIEQAGVDVILVGDSLGTVIHGRDKTLSVTLSDMQYHLTHVAYARKQALLICDMPYHSYENINDGLSNAKRLLESGADMVKLEGADTRLKVVKALVDNQIPVCGHLGLLPQSVDELGGYKVQGREQAAADKILDDALQLQTAGVDMLVLECIPKALGKRISESLTIPTIGIGAGIDCDGQVLVLYDLIGLTPGRLPRFVKNFFEDLPQGAGITEAIIAFVTDVRQGRFPTQQHSY